MEEIFERLELLEFVADDVTESDLSQESKKLIMDIVAKELIAIRDYLKNNVSSEEMERHYR